MAEGSEQGAPRRATLKDVAALAGVSRATAARALNSYGYVGEEAAEKVRAAAETLGYHGNRVAQALRQGQLPLVGFVSGDIQNPFFARCRVALKWGHPQFVCHGLTELHRLKGSGRGIEEALGSYRQRGGW